MYNLFRFMIFRTYKKYKTYMEYGKQKRICFVLFSK